MSPKKTTGIVCAILVITTILIIGLLYRSDLNEADDLLNAYNKNTQHFDRTTVTQVVEQVRRDEQDTGGSEDAENPFIPVIQDPSKPTHPQMPGMPPAQTPTQPPTASGWTEALVLAHRAMGNSGCKYSNGGTATLRNGDFVRTDCSGYISYALQVYGKLSKGQMYNSASFGSCPAVTDVTSQIKSISDLQVGDLIRYSGHIEAYAGNGRVYNWGGHSSAQDKYANCNGHSDAECKVDVTSNMYRKFGEIMNVYRLK